MDKKQRHTYKRTDVIDKIIELRIQKGLSILNILDILQKEMKYSASYSYELIRNAREIIDERSLQLFGESIKEDIERFENLYEKAMMCKNFKEAREILKEISKLKGHYIERVEISGDLTHRIPDIIEINEVRKDD